MIHRARDILDMTTIAKEYRRRILDLYTCRTEEKGDKVLSSRLTGLGACSAQASLSLTICHIETSRNKWS